MQLQTRTARALAGGGVRRASPWRPAKSGVRHAPKTSAARSAGATVALQSDVVPLFPVQPIGVFLPGMTKTLQIYEAHNCALFEEAMEAQQQLFATAILEPYMGEGHAQGPGSFVGGNNFMISSACLCKIISSKPYPGGYLVRVRGECRVGVSSLEATSPYLRTRVFPMADAPMRGCNEAAGVAVQLSVLRGVMRDVQELASKFRCNETASIQQAMRWVGQPPLAGLPAVMGLPIHQPPVNQPPVNQPPASQPPASQPPERRAGDGDAAGAVAGEQSGSSGSSSSSGGPAGAVADEGEEAERRQTDGLGGSGRSEDVGAGGGAGGFAGSSGPSGGVGVGGGDVGGLAARVEAQERGRGAEAGRGAGGEEGVEDMVEEEEDVVEVAARLSFAALQWLPQSTPEEKVELVRSRLLAIDCYNLPARLELVTNVVTAQRDSLAAKVAIMGAEPPAGGRATAGGQQ
ncbi:hypothetical protein FOA52_016074 [Chlamydomonas sp. UWO 241]|nr:hypothetical protein FOA52_016074 [Chlamydomonas sp. UWO 241]